LSSKKTPPTQPIFGLSLQLQLTDDKKSHIRAASPNVHLVQHSNHFNLQPRPAHNQKKRQKPGTSKTKPNTFDRSFFNRFENIFDKEMN
jgi:hypothetical protein